MVLKLRGKIPFGVPALTSMRHGTRHVIERGAFGPNGPMTFPGESASEGVYLLLGYDYGNVLASTAARSLAIVVTDEALEWATSPLAKTATEEQARRLLRAGLLGGVVPGYVPVKTADDAGTEVVESGMLCELNIVGRPPGDGSTLQSFTGRPGGAFQGLLGR